MAFDLGSIANTVGSFLGGTGKGGLQGLGGLNLGNLMDIYKSYREIGKLNLEEDALRQNMKVAADTHYNVLERQKKHDRRSAGFNNLFTDLNKGSDIDYNNKDRYGSGAPVQYRNSVG